MYAMRSHAFVLHSIQRADPRIQASSSIRDPIPRPELPHIPGSSRIRGSTPDWLLKPVLIRPEERIRPTLIRLRDLTQLRDHTRLRDPTRLRARTRLLLLRPLPHPTRGSVSFFTNFSGIPSAPKLTGAKKDVM